MFPHTTVSAEGKTGRFEVLSIERVQPSDDVAERIGVSAKTKPVPRRENVLRADDDPVHRVMTRIHEEASARMLLP